MIPTVGKLSIVSLVVYFVIYLIIHIAIGFLKEQATKEIMEKPGNREIENRLKWTIRAFQWWPPIAVVLVIIILYLQ